MAAANGEKMAEYDRRAVEARWQDFWEKEELFRFDPKSDAPIYSIDVPPRYASGGLHAGHSVHYTHIDFAGRYKRLRGYNVFYPLCFDVNGMPIEVNVEKRDGIKMRDVDRQEFVRRCSEFANNNIADMIRQFKILGEAMDPSIYYQTDADYYRRVTQISFIKMFKEGLIYRDDFPINWCTRCGTALAESEVEYKDRETKLNTIHFKIKETGEDMDIATTRPELLCTCQMIALNPDDPRAEDLAGKTAVVPLFDREVPIRTDQDAELGFGTGIVMVCSIGDKGDLEWMHRYDLENLKGIDSLGCMTDLAGPYRGLPVAEARARVIDDIRSAGLLVKQEVLEQNVGCCWRCSSPIEFISLPQWFLKIMDYKDQVLAAADEMDWFPDFMKIRLREWINCLSWDWVISRQRWFATPIPAWTCSDCGDVQLARAEDCYIDPTITAPYEETCKCGGSYRAVEDVFDTWMDSSISPLYNSFWQRDDEMFDKLYPMSLRPQSHDIIRTWAFYTMLRGLRLTGERPFNEIMIGGFILSPDGTPMHASKGNAVDPMQILEDYGADALRYYAATCSLGKDHPIRIQEIKRGSQVTRKLLNAGNLMGSAIASIPDSSGEMRDVDHWLMKRFAQAVEEVTRTMDSFQFDKALDSMEDFLWHVLADHYLEMSKWRIYEAKDPAVRQVFSRVGPGLLQLFAAFLPHVTEEVYQNHFKKDGTKTVHLSGWPEIPEFDEEAAARGEMVKDICAAVRNYKSEKGVSLGSEIPFVELVTQKAADLEGSLEDIKQTARAREITVGSGEDLKETVAELKPVHSKVGPEFRQDAPKVKAALAMVDAEAALRKLEEGSLELELEGGAKVTLKPEHVETRKALTVHGKEVDSVEVGDVVVLIGL